MKKRKQEGIRDCSTERRRRRRRRATTSTTMTLVNSQSKPIPPDIIFDIFTRCPVKSLMRFRALSKSCATIISDPSFSKLHSPRPPTQPRLLITCPTALQSAQTFFSATLNGGSAIHHLTIPPRYSRYTTHSLNGILCMDFGLCATLCNPSTCQSITLPLITSPSAVSSAFYCVNSLGFDPVTKQYKVLNCWAVDSIVVDNRYVKVMEYRVFTLGTSSWRRVDGGPSCFPQRESVCVDGVIFFRGVDLLNSRSQAIMVAFDVRTESFREVRIPELAPKLVEESDLVQFNGNPAIVDFKLNSGNKVTLWILDDYCKGVWAVLNIHLPSSWNEIRGNQKYVVVGVVNGNELLLAPRTLSTPFYVLYYDFERGSLRRVEISGLPEYSLLDLSCNTVTLTIHEDNILSLT